MSPAKQRVEIDGRTLSVSNLDKVLFPEVGFTKAQVIDYYVRIAPVLLPHLAGRPVTFTRWPDGVDGQTFFEKNAPRHAPEWVRRVTDPEPGQLDAAGRRSTSSWWSDRRPGLGGQPGRAGAARAAVAGRRRRACRQLPDLLVLDLDPGPGDRHRRVLRGRRAAAASGWRPTGWTRW